MNLSLISRTATTQPWSATCQILTTTTKINQWRLDDMKSNTGQQPIKR